MIDSAWMTFVLLIAIRVFQAPALIKAWMASSAFWGYCLNPWMIGLAARVQWPATRLASCYLALNATLMGVAASQPSLLVYTPLMVAWMVFSSQVSPLMVHVYTQHYPKVERGRRCASVFLIASVGGSLFSYTAGRCLDANLDYYRWVLLSFAAAGYAAAYCLSRIPSTPIPCEANARGWSNVGLIIKDRLFGWVVLAWTLMSLGQWMVMPLRLEYLTHPSYGLQASNQQVALVTFVIPALAQALSMKPWGLAFDHYPVLYVRIAVNLCIVAGVLIFFHVKTLLLLGVATGLMGLGSGGSMLLSHIWVTKLAGQPGKAPAYMSAHAFVSGLRGLCAPFLGYWLIGATSPSWTAALAATLGIGSMLMFAYVAHHPRLGEGQRPKFWSRTAKP
jgi:hypothetical protein